MKVTLAYGSEIVPYVRMTQRGKYVKENARRYLASKESLAWAMRLFLSENDLPIPLISKGAAFWIEFQYRSARLFTYDLDNLAKAILDAGNGILWEDDRYCVRITAAKESAPEAILHLSAGY